MYFISVVDKSYEDKMRVKYKIIFSCLRQYMYIFFLYILYICILDYILHHLDYSHNSYKKSYKCILLR